MKKVYTLILALIVGVFLAGADISANEVVYDWTDWQSADVVLIGSSSNILDTNCKLLYSGGTSSQKYAYFNVPENAKAVKVQNQGGMSRLMRHCAYSGIVINANPPILSEATAFLNTFTVGWLDVGEVRQTALNGGENVLLIHSADTNTPFNDIKVSFGLELPPPPPPPSFADIMTAGADVIISFFLMIGLVFGAIFDILLTPVILLPLSVILIALSFAYARRIIAVIRRIFGG